MENKRAIEEDEIAEPGRVSEPNWSERVEDLVAAGDVTAAISFLESLVTNLQSRFGSSSSSGDNHGGKRTEIGLQLASALTQLADLYSSQGLSLKSDETHTRSSLIKQRALDCDLASSRGSGDSENQAVPQISDSNGLNSDPNVSPANGKVENSSKTSDAQDCSDDDWEALADREPSKVLSVEELPEISKLSVEEPKVQGPKRCGRGTFTCKRDVMYSDRNFGESRFDDSEDNDMCRGSEKNDESLKWIKVMDFRYLLGLSMVLRVFLIIYGEWQDTHMEVRYTDVDYMVFSDAAALMVSGKSPYKRTTYRYTPLLAFLLIPNSIFHRSWGKFLFSASDLLVGVFIRTILKQRKVPEKICTYSVMVWLLNPFTFTIGTRGNCEPIVCAMILWIIISLMQGNLSQAAFWYGLVVHFRVYPIIYALPIILVLDSQIFRSGKKPPLEDWNTGQVKTPTSNTEKKTFHLNLLTALKSLFSKERIMFGLISGGVFLACNVVSFYFYGHEFLHEALLYHLTRTDPRHNFSIYFYHIYLHYERQFSAVEKLISFLPQFTVQFALVFSFSQDLVFCIFLQTVAFVAFNKVITAQYFVWFYCLLPLILPWSRMKLKWEGLLCIILWIGAQTHWLLWGYMLEFKGYNVFLQLWIASLVFLAANTFVLIKIIQRHRFSPLFKRYESSDPKNVTKHD